MEIIQFNSSISHSSYEVAKDFVDMVDIESKGRLFVNKIYISDGTVTELLQRSRQDAENEALKWDCEKNL